MQKFKKFVVTSLAVLALFLSISVCSLAATIDKLSVVDNTIYASVSESNVTLFAAEYSEGLLNAAFFAESDNSGYVELNIVDAEEYKLFLWDRTTLAPVSCSYKLINDVAFAEDGDKVPPYERSSYYFNQDDNVMIVSEISSDYIKGFKGGSEVTYSLTKDAVVLGRSDSMADVVPGSVVLIGTDKMGNCSAIELLASLGIPVDPSNFENKVGIYAPCDGSEQYKNIVTEMFSKSGINLTTFLLDENGEKISYGFESGSSMCYRVGIAMDNGTPVISCTGSKISTYPSIFEKTSEYHNYLYLRYNNETGKVKECVFYCVPKDFDPTKGDGEYSDIFNLKPIVIIK